MFVAGLESKIRFAIARAMWKTNAESAEAMERTVLVAQTQRRATLTPMRLSTTVHAKSSTNVAFAEDRALRPLFVTAKAMWRTSVASVEGLASRTRSAIAKATSWMCAEFVGVTEPHVLAAPTLLRAITTLRLASMTEVVISAAALVTRLGLRA